MYTRSSSGKSVEKALGRSKAADPHNLRDGTAIEKVQEFLLVQLVFLSQPE